MNITVYLGSHMGADPVFKEATVALGKWIAEHGNDLVYGGSQNGLMGVLADTVLFHGGKAVGIMPEFLMTRERVHPGLTSLMTVATMSERKHLMMEMGDVLIALPGGPGTLEEISEVISLARVGQNSKPCVLLNIKDYYKPLEAQFDAMVAEGFLTPEVRAKTLFADDLDAILPFVAAYTPSTGGR